MKMLEPEESCWDWKEAWIHIQKNCSKALNIGGSELVVEVCGSGLVIIAQEIHRNGNGHLGKSA